METEETYVAPIAPSPLILTTEGQSYLVTAGKWATFLGVLGFIFSAIILLFALSVGSIIARVATLQPFNPMLGQLAGFGGFITGFYILLDLVNFFFALYLFQFGQKVKAGVSFQDPLHLAAGLGKLKSFFTLWGVVTIVAIVLNVVAVIGVVIFVTQLASAFQH